MFPSLFSHLSLIYIQVERTVRKELAERDAQHNDIIKEVAHSITDVEQSFRHIKDSLDRLIVKKDVD